MLINFHQVGNNNTIWINPAFVTCVTPARMGAGTCIWVAAEDGWNEVTESPEEVVERINGGQSEGGEQEDE